MERRNLCSKRNKNHATVKTEVTWFCVGNAACPPHALRQVCEEQGGLGTATPGSSQQTTATNVQMAPSDEHPWKQPAHTRTGLGPALLHRMASCPAAARNRCKYKLCLHDVMSGCCATQSSHSSWESGRGMLKKCVHVSGEQDICPTVRHSDWSNAKPVHKWTHGRLKPTKIQKVKKCPECILRGSAKPLLWVAWPLPSPAHKDVLKDDLREHCYQPSAQRADGTRPCVRDGKTSLHCLSSRVLHLTTSNFQTVNKVKTCFPRSAGTSILKESRVMNAAGDVENMLNLSHVRH